MVSCALGEASALPLMLASRLSDVKSATSNHMLFLILNFLQRTLQAGKPAHLVGRSRRNPAKEHRYHHSHLQAMKRVHP